MVDVRVRQDNPIDCRRIDGEVVPIPLREFFGALKKAAVNQQPLSFYLYQIFRTSYGARRA